MPGYRGSLQLMVRESRQQVFRDLLECLAEDLRLRGQLDLTEGFVAATFTSAKKEA